MCKALNHYDSFLVFVSAFSGCVSISAFASLIFVPVGIASSAVGLENFAVTAGIKKSIVKKKRKKSSYSVISKN